MSIAVLAGKKRKPRSIWIPISVKLFVKAYRDAIEAWNQTGAFTFKLVTNEKKGQCGLDRNG